MFRKACFQLWILFVVAGCALAQEAPPQQPPVQAPPTQQPPAVPPSPVPVAAPSPPIAAAAIVPAPFSPPELRRRREAIDSMEGVLPKRVLAAARDTMRDMETAQQGTVNLFTNRSPRASGFHLEGYGVFFYVEIPGVRASVASAFEQIQRNMQRADRASRTPEATPLPFDANASYTDAVKRHLIDAMLDFGQVLDLRPHEWLTIAARDADDPIPNVIYESITMVVRAKATDLADFRAGRITREEMLKRVEVRGF